VIKSMTMISGFRRDANEICALLGCEAASSLVRLLTLEDGTDRLCRNVGKQQVPPRNIRKNAISRMRLAGQVAHGGERGKAELTRKTQAYMR
jgi:hypothetical protein